MLRHLGSKTESYANERSKFKVDYEFPLEARPILSVKMLNSNAGQVTFGVEGRQPVHKFKCVARTQNSNDQKEWRDGVECDVC